MNRIERAIIIIIGVIISVIVGIEALMLFPYPYGLIIGIGLPSSVIYLVIKKVKLDFQSQNDEIQKLKDKVEELEKDKDKK